jgi:hypothetical protein
MGIDVVNSHKWNQPDQIKWFIFNECENETWFMKWIIMDECDLTRLFSWVKHYNPRSTNECTMFYKSKSIDEWN